MDEKDNQKQKKDFLHSKLQLLKETKLSNKTVITSEKDGTLHTQELESSIFSLLQVVQMTEIGETSAAYKFVHGDGSNCEKIITMKKALIKGDLNL